MTTKPTTDPAPTAPSSIEPLHRLHSYCARFPSEIAEAVVDQFTSHGDSVWDPFCGSGTDNRLWRWRLSMLLVMLLGMAGIAVALGRLDYRPWVIWPLYAVAMVGAGGWSIMGEHVR
jgi:DNA methylase